MPDMLADLFAASQSSVVDWEGQPAYSMLELDTIPDAILVEFLSATAVPVQGLRMKFQGGVLEVANVSAQELLLWRDTAPDQVLVRVRRNRGQRNAPSSLKIWNVWRGGLDVTQAWLGNAGMRVERASDGNRIELHCSDGEGSAVFSDLVVALTLHNEESRI